MATKKDSGKGGHHLSPFWPSNASQLYRVNPGSATHLTQIGARRLEGLLCLRIGPFRSGGNTYKLGTIKEILSPKGFQKLAISAILEEV